MPYRISIVPNPAAAFFDDETLELFAIFAQGRINPFKL
jgi:hypothetical protein